MREFVTPYAVCEAINVKSSMACYLACEGACRRGQLVVLDAVWANCAPLAPISDARQFFLIILISETVSGIF